MGFQDGPEAVFEAVHLRDQLAVRAEQVADEPGHQRSGSEGFADRRDDGTEDTPDGGPNTRSEDGEHERNLARIGDTFKTRRWRISERSCGGRAK